MEGCAYSPNCVRIKPERGIPLWSGRFFGWFLSCSACWPISFCPCGGDWRRPCPSCSLRGGSPTVVTGSKLSSSLYDFVIVKVPDPLQPTPVKDQVPVIKLPFAVPESCSVLPLGVTESTASWNFPVTFPLKLPVSANDPLSVSPDPKQDGLFEKVNLVTLSVPSLFTTRKVEKANIVLLPLSVSVAVQFPLMLAGLSDPQPTRVRIPINNIATADFFI